MPTGIYKKSKEHGINLSKSLKGRKISTEAKIKMSISHKGIVPWNKGRTGIYSEETLKKLSIARKGKKHSEKVKNHLSMVYRHSIEKIHIIHAFFSKIEEMRYNPDKPEEKEIQVHCKNYNCKNSKEKGGWFTPTRRQIEQRTQALEKQYGSEEHNFYCSENCKKECPLYNLKNDPYKSLEKPYTQEEYETFRQFVLKRDNYKCQFCGEKANHVHHERSQKLEPFFSLDPDYAWSCCEKCHYKFGHKDECSTGNLANKIC